MTRAINLISLVQAQEFLISAEYEKYISRHGIAMRANEVADLRSMVDELHANQPAGRAFDRFYVGYQIPQIGKEFDLLKFGENYHVNLELKSDCDHSKMQRQLLRNKYYLSYLGLDCYFVSYSSCARKFFALDGDGKLIEVTAKDVGEMLSSQVVDDSLLIDERFNPSNYLVSPFNSPDKFLLGQYFLTAQQEDVKSQISALFAGHAPNVFIALTGAAGTGKTLLAYDIVNKMTSAARTPLIIHCGKLNSGHDALIAAGWRIISVKDMARVDLGSFGCILIDEAQRIRSTQFESVVAEVVRINGRCIFSYDRSQTLADHETRSNIGALIEAIPGVSKFALSEKIRTNREIASFIKAFVRKSRGIKIHDSGNIQLIYFRTTEDATRHVSSLSSSEWKVIKFTPSQYSREHHVTYSEGVLTTSHDVIGQEFDGVAVMVDRFFDYNEEGVLVYTGGAYYQPAKMLFQNMTRARSRLQVIIINNPRMLDACMDIFV